MRIDAGELQGARFKVCPFKRLNMGIDRLTWVKTSGIIHQNWNTGNLKQGIGFWIEPCCLYIHHHGQVIAKTVGNSHGFSCGGHTLPCGKKQKKIKGEQSYG